MAKTESTAVNELIGLVQSGKSTPQGDPAGDLLFDERPAASTRVQPPRVTTTVPPMRGAGEVAPLPPKRAPHSTASHQQVRMRTASPTRGTTIPPIARGSAPPPVPSRTVTIPPRTTGSHPVATAPLARPSSPPPIPSRTKTPSQQIVPPPVDDTDNDVDWDVATQATMPRSGPMPVAKPIDHIDDMETPVTHSSPTLPSPRVTQPSFPALPKPRPTLPMPKQSAPKLPPPRSTPRASEPPPIGEPFVARSLMNETVNEPTPTDVDIDMDFTPEAKPAAKPARAKSEPPAPWESTLAPLVIDPTSDISAKIGKNDSTWVGKPVQSSSLARKLVIPAVAATVIGIGIGAYLAGQSKKQQHAPQAAAQKEEAQFAPAVAMPEVQAPAQQATEPTLTHDVPAPEAAPAPEAVPTTDPLPEQPAAKVAFVDVRIDSNPAGATAVLVDNGKTSFLGTTPLATSLDPSRAYDIVFTYDDRPTQMAHLDPSKETRVSVTMPKESSSSRHHRAPTPAAALADTIEKPAPKAKEAAPAADAGGEGTLMVSSKPPCDILIDGKPTGLTTPQRSIALSAGNHKVTFVNEAESIKKTFSVTITADKPTKLIQDLMPH